MASRGSVIPLFYNQLINDKPLTITNPEMTRFMMTLQNAVELVLYAFENGESGDIFVQKAPSSTIGQLADVMKNIYKSKSVIKILELDMEKRCMKHFCLKKKDKSLKIWVTTLEFLLTTET
jgi:UDP-glucose 4-epimerase